MHTFGFRNLLVLGRLTILKVFVSHCTHGDNTRHFWDPCMCVCMSKNLLISIRKEKKNQARTLYQHECEPVIQMFNSAGRVVA